MYSDPFIFKNGVMAQLAQTCEHLTTNCLEIS